MKRRSAKSHNCNSVIGANIQQIAGSFIRKTVVSKMESPRLSAVIISDHNRILSAIIEINAAYFRGDLKLKGVIFRTLGI
jgi:hypothetical protein